MIHNESKLLLLAVLNGAEQKRQSGEGSGVPALATMAFWDGVTRMAQLTLDVAALRTTSDDAMAILFDYAGRLSEYLSQEVDEDGPRDDD